MIVWKDWHTGKQTRKMIDRVSKFEQMGGQTNGQTDRQRDRQSHLVYQKANSILKPFS